MTEDVKITSELTGIPRSLIRDAVQSEQVKNIKGGNEAYIFLTEECGIVKGQYLELIHMTKKPNGIEVDTKKMKEVGEFLKAQNNDMRKATMLLLNLIQVFS